MIFSCDFSRFLYVSLSLLIAVQCLIQSTAFCLQQRQICVQKNKTRKREKQKIPLKIGDFVNKYSQISVICAEIYDFLNHILAVIVRFFRTTLIEV